MKEKLDLRCESRPVANMSCARGSLHIEGLCIQAIRKAVGVIGVVFEGVEGVAEEAGLLLVGDFRELVKAEKIVHGLLIKGSVRLKSVRKARIAGRDGEREVARELD